MVENTDSTLKYSSYTQRRAIVYRRVGMNISVCLPPIFVRSRDEYYRLLSLSWFTAAFLSVAFEVFHSPLYAI